ncbi:TIM barrel protein [candidate division KSB1 bacterium]|nr:TIM barrel protein [candidate division KSB1 bacterium]
MIKRRDFLRQSAQLAGGLGLASLAGTTLVNCSKKESDTQQQAASTTAPAALFQISLAEWSHNKAIFGGQMNHLDFPMTAKKEYGITAVELVNQFFMDKAKDTAYLQDFKNRAESEGVKVLLIMCDREGNLGDPDAAKRTQAVENHYKWVEAAKFFGCHSIRVNAASEGSYEEQQKLAADGLARLTEYGAQNELNVIVENHGGLSSNGAWLSGVMRMVNHPRCGTLPDFGNFCVRFEGANWETPCAEMYDRYQGVQELMPFAKAVSAKSHEFDENGNEVQTDYTRMMKIVVEAGYHGYVGIEYEGDKLSEADGIRATKALLEKFMREYNA